MERLAELGARRLALLAELNKLTDEVRPAALAALADGEKKLEVSRFTGVSRATLDKWLTGDRPGP